MISINDLRYARHWAENIRRDISMGIGGGNFQGGVVEFVINLIAVREPHQTI
jgi:hypothetical protein